MTEDIPLRKLFELSCVMGCVMVVLTLLICLWFKGNLTIPEPNWVIISIGFVCAMVALGYVASELRTENDKIRNTRKRN